MSNLKNAGFWIAVLVIMIVVAQVKSRVPAVASLF